MSLRLAKNFLFLLVCGIFCLCAVGCGGHKTSAVDKQPQTVTTVPQNGTYTMRDIARLERTEHFAPNAVAHIFDGSINKKGKATGYHYSQVTDSQGKIIEGTRSAVDSRGVFTAKVEVSGVPKNGFSSFYPENWSPQQVVDSINVAYESALADPDNPHGSLWIGYSGDLEIDMYLTDDKKIITAYPIFAGKK